MGENQRIEPYVRQPIGYKGIKGNYQKTLKQIVPTAVETKSGPDKTSS